MRKHLPIPAAVVAMALRDGKLKQARDSTYSKAKQEIEDLLEPQVNRQSKSFWGKFRSQSQGGGARKLHSA